MSNVASLPREREERSAEAPIAEQKAAAAGLMAAVDAISAAVTGPVNAARKELDALEEVYLQDVARIRTNLELMLDGSQRVTKSAAVMTKLAEELRAERADLINAKVRV